MSLEPPRLAGRSWLVVDEVGGATLAGFFDLAAASLGAGPPRRVPRWLFSALAGTVLLETLGRDLRARPSELLATGFRFTYPTVEQGLPATLRELGYSKTTEVSAQGRAQRRRWWLIVALTFGAIAFVNTIDLPLTVPRLRALSRGEPILDMRLGYGPRAAYQLLEALGSSGRASYLAMLWTVDLALPALFSVFLWTALSRGALRRWRWAAVAPGATDYLENAAVTALLLGYPVRHVGLVALASAMTASKFLLYLAGLALAAAGWLIQRRRTPGPARAPRHERRFDVEA